MADPKNIESILAALAQRPPTTTPNPAPMPLPAAAPYQQSPTPSAYPPTMPPGVSYGGSGYPMPQPPAAGGLDLSAIKPVNSGTVSIADAIAQAKAFATEKGISSYDLARAPPAPYQSHDPHAGDGRGHYRSRSRSPPARRDAYRDNFNPYRDERRDEHRGYGRDRSMSPGPNRGRFSPRGGASNRGGDRGAGGGGDDDAETIQIESSLVGLIIGRQGENLRRVESETGCRVQFMTPPDNQTLYRQCRISGPRPRRAEAKAAIDRIIEDSGMGAVARSGLDKGGRSGSAGAGGAAAAAAAAAAHAPAPGTLRDGEDCMQIMVPDRTVGLIIGRGGETIRDLQERSGCHINIVGENKSVNGLRPVNLIGSREAAAQAKEQIMEIVDSDSRNVNGGGKQERPHRHEHGRDGGHVGGGGGGGGDKINDSIYVPSEAVGMIIGKGGETIREMQSQTGCKINVSQSSGPGEVEREIGLVGSRDAINRAKRAIEDKVEAVRQKNSGGGGGGGRGRPRRDFDNPNYSQQGGGSTPHAPTAQSAADAPAGADPYAAYGGYQAYLALWYQAIAQQQNGQQGDAPPPAGA